MALQRATRRIGSPQDRVVATVARYASDPLDQLLKLPIVDGVLLKDVSLTSASPIDVEHRLERAPVGYMVVRKSGPGDISDADASIPDRFITLSTTIDVTVDLWVF